MKIDRLIGILSILLQREKVTAPYLAEVFEVSRRTISRDIEALCRAGIPIATAQGAGGGISIMGGYRLDRALLTAGDMQAILAGLKGLDSVSGTKRYAQLMEKLAGPEMSGGDLRIDLASWYREPLSERLGLLREAIFQGREVLFHYYAPSGESDRAVEPYTVLFQWGGWYLWAWCRTREDYRLFKLSRMTRVKLGECFQKRPAPEPDLSDRKVFPENLLVRAVVPAKYKWRLVEEYGEGAFIVEPDGSCLCSIGFTRKDSALDWLLSFRGEAQLLEPEELRASLRELGEKLRDA